MNLILISIGIILISLLMMGIPGKIIFSLFTPILRRYHGKQTFAKLDDQYAQKIAMIMSVLVPAGITPAYLLSYTHTPAALVDIPANVMFVISLLLWACFVSMEVSGYFLKK